MRWLLDQGVPRSTVSLLAARGQDVVHVADVAMSAAPDIAIIEHAFSDDRIVVTFDADFHAILAVSGKVKPTVIRIREEGLKGPQICALLFSVLTKFQEDLERGCVMTNVDGKVRLRALPL